MGRGGIRAQRSAYVFSDRTQKWTHGAGWPECPALVCNSRRGAKEASAPALGAAGARGGGWWQGKNGPLPERSVHIRLGFTREPGKRGRKGEKEGGKQGGGRGSE